MFDIMSGLSPTAQLRAAAVLATSTHSNNISITLNFMLRIVNPDYVRGDADSSICESTDCLQKAKAQALLSWICRGAIGYSASKRGAFFMKPTEYDNNRPMSQIAHTTKYYMRIVDAGILGTEMESTTSAHGTFWEGSIMERISEDPTYYMKKNIPGHKERLVIGSDTQFYSQAEYPVTLGGAIDDRFQGPSILHSGIRISDDETGVSIDMGDVMAKAVSMSTSREMPFPLNETTETLEDAVAAVAVFDASMDAVDKDSFRMAFTDYMSRPCYTRNPRCIRIKTAIVKMSPDGFLAQAAGHRLLPSEGIDLSSPRMMHHHFSSRRIGDPMGLPSRNAGDFCMGNKYLRIAIDSGIRSRAEISGIVQSRDPMSQVSMYHAFQRYTKYQEPPHKSARTFCMIVDECRMARGTVPMAHGSAIVRAGKRVPSCFSVWARQLGVKLLPSDTDMRCPLLTPIEATSIGCSTLGRGFYDAGDVHMFPAGYCKKVDTDTTTWPWPQAFCGSKAFSFDSDTDDVAVSIHGSSYLIPVSILATSISQAAELFPKMQWVAIPSTVEPSISMRGTRAMLEAALRAHACDTSRLALSRSDSTGMSTGSVKDSFRLRDVIAQLPSDILVLIMDHVMETRTGSSRFPHKELDNYTQSVRWATKFPTCEPPFGTLISPEAVLNAPDPLRVFPAAITYQDNLCITQRECLLLYKMGHEALLDIAESEGEGALGAIHDMEGTMSRPTEFPATNLAVSLLLPCDDGEDPWNWMTYGTSTGIPFDSNLIPLTCTPEGLETRDLSRGRPWGPPVTQASMSLYAGASSLEQRPVNLKLASCAQKAALLCIRQSVNEMIASIHENDPENGKDEVGDPDPDHPSRSDHKKRRV